LGPSSNELSAAIIAGAVAIIVAILTSIITVRVATMRAKVDERLLRTANDFSERLKAQEAQQQQALEKLKAALVDQRRTGAATIARSLLLQHSPRSFDRLKRHIRGFSDDELRQILIGLPAMSVPLKPGGREGWKLVASDDLE
jgi:hypothetical protein